MFFKEEDNSVLLNSIDVSSCEINENKKFYFVPN